MKKIIVDPDPRLRKICPQVTSVDGKLRKLADEMISFIRKGKVKSGKTEVTPLGLAAPQMGELVSLFVIDTPNYSLVMMNPKIVKVAGSHKVYEGCLSLPGRLFVVERPKVIKFKGLDLEGRERSIKLHDLLARVAIHEIQHLGGIMVDNVALGEAVEGQLGRVGWKKKGVASPK